MSKRIHWSQDGTLAWLFVQNTQARTALTANQKNLMDSAPDQVNDPGTSFHDGVIFNFPGPISIDLVRIKAKFSESTMTMSVSSDSTDGFDGTWDEVLSSAIASQYVYYDFAPTATEGTWLKINFDPSANDFYPICVHLFGAYSAPRFEFWAADGSAELTDNYPLAMASAPNLDDYHGSGSFKLKNTDNVQHSYSLTIGAVKYGGDNTIANNYTLSTDGGTTKLLTVTVEDLAAGALSGVIDVYGDVLKASNPADGYHYFVIDVTETA